MDIILDKCNNKNIMVAKLWIEDGSRADPKDLKGIHQILSSTILRGCGPYNNQKLAEIIESSGANLNCDTYEDGILISLKCIEIDAYKLLPLIGWMITKPLLETGQIELEKDLTIKAIKRQKESTYQQAFDAWRKMVYTNGPYGHDPLGSIDDISKIKREHLLPIANSLINRKKNLVISGKFPVNIENYIKNSIAFKRINKVVSTQDQFIKSSNQIELIYKQKSNLCTRCLNTKQVILLIGKATINYKNESVLLRQFLQLWHFRSKNYQTLFFD